MKYKIEQFPKFRPDSERQLNGYQIIIRNNQKKYVYEKTKSCSVCGVIQDSEKEFYIKDSETGRKSKYCRDCSLRKQGTLNIGKKRVENILYDKGIRKCTLCETTMPLSDFPKKTNAKGGKSNSCIDCTKKTFNDMKFKYHAKTTKLKCYVCNEQFEKKNGEIKRSKIHYCSRECYQKSDLLINNIVK